MNQQRSILDQIQALSNERQRLYLQKWSLRNRQGYRERLQTLNEQIEGLWYLRRKELAGPPLSATRPIEVEHFSEVEDEANTVQSFADVIDQVGVQVLLEVLAELREDDEVRRAIPLRAILAKRNRTLQWTDLGRGRFASREVSLSTPS